MNNSLTDPLEYLEQNKAEFIFTLTEEMGQSEETALMMFDFMTETIKGLKPLRASKSLTEAYIEERFRHFHF